MSPTFVLLAAAFLVSEAGAADTVQDLGAHFPGFRSALILVQDPPGPGLVYRGKTGSCQDPGASDPHGWWVGSIESEGRLHVYAALIEGPGASGMVRRPMAEKALAALGVLPPR